MRITRKYDNGCSDGTCPAIFDTDDEMPPTPEIVWSNT